MNQAMAFNWAFFGFILADALLFGIFYALFVRWISKAKIEGQTAYLVVGGVSAVLLLASVMVGLVSMAILFALFAAAGLPMVIEYVDRVHHERRRDLEALKRFAQEEVGDEHKAADR